jgi:iron(III) transport system permease protein
LSRISRLLARLPLCAALVVFVAWPVLATVIEAVRAAAHGQDALPRSGLSLDPEGRALAPSEPAGVPRPILLAEESVLLVAVTLAIALPAGVLLALLLFRTDVLGRRVLLAVIALAALVPLSLQATAWLGALGNAGRAQIFGVRPILVGRTGAAFVHAMAALPWVVLIVGAGLSAVEPELEESALLEIGPIRVLWRVTLRRALLAIAAAALAVAVLTAGDMTVTDLLLIRTYAEEAFLQYSLGNGPGEAALVAVPPILVLGALILVVSRAIDRLDPARVISSFERSRVWRLGRWRIPAGMALVAVIGNMVALPLYSLLWRAGRVGGRATLGRPPTWSLAGLSGTLRSAALEIRHPLLATLLWTAIAATVTAALAGALAWSARRSMPWRSILLATLAVTLASPGPVAGMALVLGYRSFPIVYDSPAMIVMAETVRSLPFALLVLWPILRAFPQDYLDAAALDGHGPFGQFVRVVLPLSLRPLLAAWAVALAIGLGELPATNLATPPGPPPMSVVIWSLLHTGVESHLAGVALIMLLVVAAAGVLAALAVWSLGARLRC